MSAKVSVDQERLAEFCRQNGVRRLAIFGSALRDDFGPSSDVDVLIEFEPGRTPGLSFFWMQEELSRLFDRTVDLHTSGVAEPLLPQPGACGGRGSVCRGVIQQ